LKNKSKKPISEDPLAEELNFGKLEIVAYGPGWKKVSQHPRRPKLLQKDKARPTRKSNSLKPRKAA
jgi:hypothetical protein